MLFEATHTHTNGQPSHIVGHNTCGALLMNTHCINKQANPFFTYSNYSNILDQSNKYITFIWPRKWSWKWRVNWLLQKMFRPLTWRSVRQTDMMWGSTVPSTAGRLHHYTVITHDHMTDGKNSSLRQWTVYRNKRPDWTMQAIIAAEFCKTKQ